MKKNPLPDSVFASTKPVETELVETKDQPLKSQNAVAEKPNKKKKRRLTMDINFDLFQRFWMYCGANNKRMNTTIEEALEAYLK